MHRSTSVTASMRSAKQHYPPTLKAMKLDRVTITGADDSVDPWQLQDLSAEFPFVEWGILFSMDQVGRPRFPTLDWVRSLPDSGTGGMRYSAHLCGRYVRDVVLNANFSWLDDASIPSNLFDRVQLNFHGQFHRQNVDLAELIDGVDMQFILQCDGPNDRAVRDLCYRTELSVPLFDTSGGAGLLPAAWPVAWPDRYCGYAGGLSPENVLANLNLIEAKTTQLYWIDMERRVRTDDDSALDLTKVRSVLEQCAGHVHQ